VIKLFLTTLFFCTTLTTGLLAKEINLNQLAAEAAKQKRHLLVWLHKTGCSYCNAMREFTIDDDPVQTIVQNHFRFVSINVTETDTVTHHDFTGSAKAFAIDLGYNFYPSTLFFDANANLIFAAPGYIKERPFRRMLDYIRSNAYQSMSYSQYRIQQGK